MWHQGIIEAKSAGAGYRTGPELEICGYSCEDHFYETDTVLHSWQVVAQLLVDPACQGILYDVGLPVQGVDGKLYNCRAVVLDAKILLVRPKLVLCNDDIYREGRHFAAWPAADSRLYSFRLPDCVTKIDGQLIAPMGDAIIVTGDGSRIGYEICEELWTQPSRHIHLTLAGNAEIIVNSSGSYSELRKCHVSFDLTKSASAKCGGVYMFSNLRGCDGQRTYFNGCSSITCNGNLVQRASQFDVREIEMGYANVSLASVSAYRQRIRSLSREMRLDPMPTIEVTGYSLICDTPILLTPPMCYIGPTPAQEIAGGPACWLWDYLRRSRQAGFFLALSGGLDSASTATCVHAMCQRLVASASQHESVLGNIRQVLGDPEWQVGDAKSLCRRLLTTCYMGTRNSSTETRDRAARIASQIGSNHLEIEMDSLVDQAVDTFGQGKWCSSIAFSGKLPGEDWKTLKESAERRPKFRVHGGTSVENLALQNLQARLRMVMSYMSAQLITELRDNNRDNPRTEKTKRKGSLLVLGSANVDESLRGYMTKYDCSSADINPIGSIAKQDLRLFLRHAATVWHLPVLEEVVQARPTAELEPLTNDGVIAQTDEADMGMSYNELAEYGKLRKRPPHCGPYSMFCHLASEWQHRRHLSPAQTAEKVKHFFRCYAINRHKMTVLTPAYHAESYSPDDNRFDHRPFLYNSGWNWQFACIDKAVERGIAGEERLGMLRNETNEMQNEID